MTYQDRQDGNLVTRRSRGGSFCAASQRLRAKESKEHLGKERDEGEVTANEDLMREHEISRRILIIYREVAALW